MSAGPKLFHEYPKEPSLEEVDKNDFVALTRARHQWVRERAVALEEIKILRDKVRECVIREEVNHPQKCKEYGEAYMKAFKKYKSQGWYKYH
jgi:hypothetical protein